ncbi:facilitated trehalose transporter Tret1-2 homolog [Schistocerca gregaria]|uniref:facilitated trehalose transporter Tret1-2 homolog n=1 Tax=Schistocerca gregaria TaxID=7010 RepID=UPI00211DD17A|nr:facilitated trehalose transporter Tret1-2 homolog [Schistocerca gregaria]
MPSGLACAVGAVARYLKEVRRKRSGLQYAGWSDVNEPLALINPSTERDSLASGYQPVHPVEKDGNKEPIEKDGASVIHFAFGTFMAWSPTTVPILQEEDSPVPLTPDQGSWIVSINSLTSLAAVLTTAYVADVFGRKTLILAGAVPALIWWLMVAFANSYEMLITARAIGSLTGGFIGGSTTMFVCEIADIKIRGTLMAFHNIFMHCGSLLMYCIAPYLPVATVAFSCISVPIIFLVTFIWMPKTPYFYLQQGRESEAVKSLVRYKGELTPEELQFELETMHKAIRQKQETKGKWKDVFLVPVYRRTLLLMLGYGLIHTSMGSIAFSNYTTYIFQKSGSEIDANVSSIIVTAVSLVASLASSFVIERVGRRPLAVGTALIMGVCLAVMGGYFYADAVQGDVNSAFDWVPLTCFICYNLCSSGASGPIGSLLTGEVFHVSVKAICLTLYSTTTALYGFVLKKLFQVVSDGLGAYYSFWAFSFMCFVCAVYMYKLLPETRGKTFAEINDDMENITVGHADDDNKNSTKTGSG